MKIKKLGALLVSAVLCAGMAAPAFAFEGEAAPVEQPVLPEVVEDIAARKAFSLSVLAAGLPPSSFAFSSNKFSSFAICVPYKLRI